MATGIATPKIRLADTADKTLFGKFINHSFLDV
jgi:hypothetical protein